MSVTLLNTTNHAQADLAVQEAIRFLQAHISNPLISVYISGSYANGYAVPSSDIDLYAIFANDLGQKEEAEFDAFSNVFDAITPQIDLVPIGKKKLQEKGEWEMEKLFLHVWGEKVSVPNPSLEDYIYRAMHGAYLYMERTRKHKPYRLPLEFPDANDTYKGYAWRKMTVQGEEQRSIKELVVLLGWMATGLVAWRGQKVVATKKECPKLFQEVIGGEHAQVFQKITDLCRNQLYYLLPKTPTEEAALQALFPGALAFENYFLAQYQHFLLSHLSDANPIRVRTSLIRMGEICYPNRLCLEAISSFVPQNESQKKAFEKTMAFLLDS